MLAVPVNGELLCKEDGKREGGRHRDRVRRSGTRKDETRKLMKESEETEIYN